MKNLNVILVFTVLLFTTKGYAEEKKPMVNEIKRGPALVGAIRWDAWHGDAGLGIGPETFKEKSGKLTPGLAVERSLGPKHWHYRLPFYAKVISDNKVEIRGNSQAVADKEIEYAAAGGIDYFAFLTYHPKSPMSLGLEYYLSSKKSDVKFCVILHHAQLDALDKMAQRILGYMKDPRYQTVLDGRPLVYLFRCKAGGGFYQDLRKRAVAGGLKAPYFVLMGPWNEARKLGFQAVSSYTGKTSAANWDRVKKAGGKVVPSVSSGWDRRPRVQNPVPWEGGKPKPVQGGPRGGKEIPGKIAARVKTALQWNAKNPVAGEANAVIIYAWNEFDEGGWICPTLSEGTARLDALKKMRAAFK